jgi:hypothetical protein
VLVVSTVEQQYFALLRAALWDTSVSVDGEIDWEAIMQMAGFHSNNVLIADVASRLADDSKLSPEMLAKMQSIMRNNLFHLMKLRQILVSSVKLLREHGIEPVVLKGFGLALLYPNPTLRQIGDTDLFVGITNFHEACTLLRTLPGSYNWGEEIDVGRHYNIEFGHISLEVHRVSADIEDDKLYPHYVAMEQEGLIDHPQRVDYGGFEISIPSKEFVVFFTFYHAWHHYLETGVGWRQLSDVTMALHSYHGQLDLDKLRQWLNTMRVMKPWQTFGYLLVECLGLPEGEMPFYDASCRKRAQKLYRQIMKEGNFKRTNRIKHKNPKRRLWHKIYAFISVFVDFFHHVGVFPAQAFHEMSNTILNSFRKNFKKK